MSPLKRLEGWAKRALALLAAALFHRPGRRSRAPARLASARRVLLVRIDDRVGEALLLTPLLSALKAQVPPFHVEALLHERCARVLEAHPSWMACGRFTDGPSFSARSPRAFGRFATRASGTWSWTAETGKSPPSPQPSSPGWWAPTASSSAQTSGPPGSSTTSVSGSFQAPPPRWPSGFTCFHRCSARCLPRGCPFGRRESAATLSPLLSKSAPRRTPWCFPGAGLDGAAFLLRCSPPPPRPFWLRAEGLLSPGARGKKRWRASVVDRAPGSVLAPSTDLDALAALLEAAGCTVCNNSGPLHLSVAVGAPTLGLFLKMDPRALGLWRLRPTGCST